MNDPYINLPEPMRREAHRIEQEMAEAWRNKILYGTTDKEKVAEIRRSLAERDVKRAGTALKHEEGQ